MGSKSVWNIVIVMLIVVYLNKSLQEQLLLIITLTRPQLGLLLTIIAIGLFIIIIYQITLMKNQKDWGKGLPNLMKWGVILCIIILTILQLGIPIFLDLVNPHSEECGFC